MAYKNVLATIFIFCVLGCEQNATKKFDTPKKTNYLAFSENRLDYRATPKNRTDRAMLLFSDQGAWFGYSFSKTASSNIGFSGPFLMTQENGVWISPSLAQLYLMPSDDQNSAIDWKIKLLSQKSFASHLEQTYKTASLTIHQQLVFVSGHSAIQKTTITNNSKNEISLKYRVFGSLFPSSITASKDQTILKLKSTKSDAIGYVQLLNKPSTISVKEDQSYELAKETMVLAPNESEELIISQSFIFSEYDWEKESQLLKTIKFDSILNARHNEKEQELAALIENAKPNFKTAKFAAVLAKSVLTLQNNWRISAGELKHQGLFPSYQYEWFHGFWSWDSWKHAAGLSYYNTALAKDQIRAMFSFQKPDGFIVDCVFRDTTIEAHNYRDTKPPLSAWAVSKIYAKDADISFITEMYPKLKKYHYWWYLKRDHDQDGLCEYGSTDGTILAAKWESGMDNAIRFDNSKIVKNSEGAYSLDQESVDLNAYLFAEKLYLASLADALNKTQEAKRYRLEAETLKKQIQHQFYNSNDGWFYDTNLENTKFIKGAGSEGWIPLWAKAASKEQAERIKNIMMDSTKFYTKVPFQTMSKDHPKFDPLNGYWRGPNWLDQAYFGVKGLRNYGFDLEADKATLQIIEGANGLCGKGESIRENYHPITGDGLYAKNFSWSAAHIIMLLMKD